MTTYRTAALLKYRENWDQETEARVSHRDMANALRALAMDAVEAAKSGHPGMPMGMADVATVLFTRFLKFDPTCPAWPDRDRFVLSAGHGSMLLYGLLHLLGVDEVSMEELRRFRQLGSLTPGHPEFGHTPGVETTTGPLGQGLANAVGMALAERMLNARFGNDLVDHHTYVIAGDGCLMEGLSHEAISLAGHLRLGRLIVLFDDNGISIDGSTSLACSDDQLARFAASGWSVRWVDGHDPDEVAEAIEDARATPRPSFIACRTVIGYGAPVKQGSEVAHGAPLGADEVAGARHYLGWPYPPFEIPDAVRNGWRLAARRGTVARQHWEQRLAAADPETRRSFEAQLSKPRRPAVARAVTDLKRRFAADRPRLATRQASQEVLNSLSAAQPNLLGGSADLTHSNNTKANDQEPIHPGAFRGRYVHYGVREHAMAAAMNGIALHGGFIPYGGTFLAFSDYCRPSIRLSALMGLRVIYVFTHDSIGLGEDGPTHQPVEHLAALRAIPNLLVFRPADAVETAEAWECALRAEHTPSVLCLTRQSLPVLRSDVNGLNCVSLGAYVLVEPSGPRDVTLIATGSEVSTAVEAARELERQGVSAAVVSAPCFEIFKNQPETYRESVLGDAPRVGVEAAVDTDWARWIGPTGAFVGMTGFGASGPAGQLFEHFGITARRVAMAARQVLERR
jgi:transketolase